MIRPTFASLSTSSQGTKKSEDQEDIRFLLTLVAPLPQLLEIHLNNQPLDMPDYGTTTNMVSHLLDRHSAYKPPSQHCPRREILHLPRPVRPTFQTRQRLPHNQKYLCLSTMTYLLFTSSRRFYGQSCSASTLYCFC